MERDTVRNIVQDVLKELRQGAEPVGGGDGGMRGSMPAISGGRGLGVFANVDEAVEAARAAQQDLSKRSLEERQTIIQGLRQAALTHAEDFSRRTLEETGMGRLEHKIAKHRLVSEKTPGPEILETKAFTGDRGMTIHEMAPYGVIGAVTPSTHPCPTLINNAISLISAGNSAVFNAHPASKRVFAYAIDILNRGIVEGGGPANLITCVVEPTIESARDLFSHSKIRLLLVTGGPGVVRAALQSNKKAITAGPGNPPVVVDETADLAVGAQGIVNGASFDNNILCIGEKEVFCVDSVFDELKREMLKRHCVELTAQQIEDLVPKAFDFKDGAGCADAVLRREFVGRNADVLAKSIGLEVPPETLLLIGETKADHVFVMEEQMMPFLPLVRCRDVDEAIERAVVAERGFGHTAVMYSKDVNNMTRMARRVNTSLFIKNGWSMAGLGAGGEGYTSFSIASPTGEGVTTARTFTRERRCTLVDNFRII